MRWTKIMNYGPWKLEHKSSDSNPWRYELKGAK